MKLSLTEKNIQNGPVVPVISAFKQTHKLFSFISILVQMSHSNNCLCSYIRLMFDQILVNCFDFKATGSATSHTHYPLFIELVISKPISMTNCQLNKKVRKLMTFVLIDFMLTLIQFSSKTLITLKITLVCNISLLTPTRRVVGIIFLYYLHNNHVKLSANNFCEHDYKRKDFFSHFSMCW